MATLEDNVFIQGDVTLDDVTIVKGSVYVSQNSSLTSKNSLTIHGSLVMEADSSLSMASSLVILEDLNLYANTLLVVTSLVVKGNTKTMHSCELVVSEDIQIQGDFTSSRSKVCTYKGLYIQGTTKIDAGEIIVNDSLMTNNNLLLGPNVSLLVGGDLHLGTSDLAHERHCLDTKSNCSIQVTGEINAKDIVLYGKTDLCVGGDMNVMTLKAKEADIRIDGGLSHSDEPIEGSVLFSVLLIDSKLLIGGRLRTSILTLEGETTLDVLSNETSTIGRFTTSKEGGSTCTLGGNAIINVLHLFHSRLYVCENLQVTTGLVLWKTSGLTVYGNLKTSFISMCSYGCYIWVCGDLTTGFMQVTKSNTIETLANMLVTGYARLLKGSRVNVGGNLTSKSQLELNLEPEETHSEYLSMANFDSCVIKFGSNWDNEKLLVINGDLCIETDDIILKKNEKGLVTVSGELSIPENIYPEVSSVFIASRVKTTPAPEKEVSLLQRLTLDS